GRACSGHRWSFLAPHDVVQLRAQLSAVIVSRSRLGNRGSRQRGRHAAGSFLGVVHAERVLDGSDDVAVGLGGFFGRVAFLQGNRRAAPVGYRGGRIVRDGRRGVIVAVTGPVVVGVANSPPGGVDARVQQLGGGRRPKLGQVEVRDPGFGGLQGRERGRRGSSGGTVAGGVPRPGQRV